jgi:hypothetical protein
MRLKPVDDGVHPPGDDPDWSESRYLDVFDPVSGAGLWVRLARRPHQGRAEVSVCVYLPDGRVAVSFARPDAGADDLAAGGLRWAIEDPFVRTGVRFDGELTVLPDGWALADPGPALRSVRRVPSRIDITSTGHGLAAVMGHDQAQIDRIFVPGQADHHFQYLARTTGSVDVGDEHWPIDGYGGKDQSWGPRNWHAKQLFRWLIAAADDDFGFMLTRAVGPTKATNGGFVWDEGRFHLVDQFQAIDTFGNRPGQLLETRVTARCGTRTWSARGRARSWIPLCHRHAMSSGEPQTLRIVKSPMTWTFEDGRAGVGMAEYHDLLGHP